MDAAAAEERLKGTLAADKNEILFSQFGINYNNEPEMYRKGSVVFRDYQTADMPAATAAIAGDGAETSKTQKEKERKRRSKAEIVVQHVDIIKDDFWNDRPWLLGSDAERYNINDP
ncbi:hypothetical protein N7G274_007947 [Stereocaulon virgatum]|uniref:Thg1 C-terminal domain-containing protein n=1 Tax=Stereocaulon virgatum TaxID=373712 RepID=A0ABR4A1D4_9LECA